MKPLLEQPIAGGNLPMRNRLEHQIFRTKSKFADLQSSFRKGEISSDEYRSATNRLIAWPSDELSATVVKIREAREQDLKDAVVQGGSSVQQTSPSVSVLGVLRKMLSTLFSTEQWNWHQALSTELNSVGIRAQAAGQKRIEDSIGLDRQTEGVIASIDIADSAIAWINFAEDESGTIRLHMGIPDQHINEKFPKISVRSSVIRTSPLFGKALSLHWKGKDKGLDLCAQLNHDALLTNIDIGTYSVRVRSVPDHACWVITDGFGIEENIRRWPVYEALTVHLFAASAKLAQSEILKA